MGPKMKPDEIPKEIGCFSSTLQRHRNDINMLAPYRKPPDSQKRKNRLQVVNMTSKDLK